MIKVFEAFAGIGTQRMALKNLGIEHEVVAIAEIDKFAIKSYEAIHGEVNNLGDISKIKKEDIPDHDLFTYSFPCQDISVAGNLKGLKKDGGTRSGLLWECERIIETKKPKYLLMENVKNLVGKRFKADFDKWLERLEELGYTNYWQVLNAKDYGIPQNRERVFCVSILGEHEPYVFPEPIELELKLKDMLEDEVDEKFYLSKKQVDRIKFSNFNQEKLRLQEKDYCDTLCARDYKDPECVQVGGLQPHVINPLKGKTEYGWHFEQQVYDENGITRTVKAGGGSGNIPKVIKVGNVNPSVQVGDFRYDEGLRIRKNGLSPCLTTKTGSNSISGNILLIKNGTKKGYIEAKNGDGIDLEFPKSKTRRGRVLPQMIQTLTTNNSKGVVVAEPKEEFGRMGKQAIETYNENDMKHGDTINPFSKKPSSDNGISPTLTTRPEGFKTAINVVDQVRIRKLTPKECWRLMGCTDEDFEKAQKVNSNTQLYKQAGNAIVVDVLEHIFYNLFKQ